MGNSYAMCIFKTNAKEKMDFGPSETQKEEAGCSASYTEGVSDQYKATPFMDVELPNQVPDTSVVQNGSAQQDVDSIQAELINLHVEEDVAPTSWSNLPQDRNHPNVCILEPASGLQRIINCSDRYVVVNNVESKTWRRLARHMNLTDMQIDRIDYDYDKDGLSEKIYRVILQWENRFRGPVLVGELVNVLKEANLHEVARKLDQ